MDNERNQRRFESVYSKKVRAGKRRTYFFDVRKTKGDDYYLTLTESTRKFNGDGYERHKIFLYKEDFNRFVSSLEEVVDYVKTELMPNYDYDEYTRRHEEFERQQALEDAGGGSNEDSTTTDNGEVESEDDMSW
ncbi:MAG: PUR family DNA/RNA-binding protein [Cyanothece sp. SIO1E1]|nr:PUR family DNA/RNA-binding protein [Cyanothece sp. SIO1E1]